MTWDDIERFPIQTCSFSFNCVLSSPFHLNLFFFKVELWMIKVQIDSFSFIHLPLWISHFGKYSDVQLDWKSTRDDSLNNFFCYTFGIVDQPFWLVFWCATWLEVNDRWFIMIIFFIGKLPMYVRLVVFSRTPKISNLPDW